MSALSALFGAAVPSALRSLTTPSARSGSSGGSPSTTSVEDRPSKVLNRPNASTLGEFISHSFEINVQINAATVRAFQSSNSQPMSVLSSAPGPGPAPDDLLEQIQGLDPKLAQGLEALLKYLEQDNPEAADAMRKSLGLVFGSLGRTSGSTGAGQTAISPTVDAPGSAPGPNNDAQIQSQRVQIAISATIADLRVQVEDGVQITAQSIQATFTANFQAQLGQSDPLVLDLDGDGFDVTPAAEGADFDLLGVGRRVRGATVAGADAFLVLDKNQNARIDDGTELFGDQNGAADGFAELARYDSNLDGRIDASDDDFGRLQLFRDANRNGATDDGELKSLSSARIAAILLDSQASTGDANGNAIARVGRFVRDDGSLGAVGDLLLNYIA